MLRTLLALFLLVFVALVTEIQTSVNVPCDKSGTATEQHQEQKQNCTRFTGPFAYVIRASGGWSHDFAHRNEKVIVALSTLVIAVFTFTLWYSTYGLWQLARKQSEDMTASLEIAKKNAIAAEKSAHISEITLLITRRADVSVTGVEALPWAPGGKFAGWAAMVTIKNTGPTKAEKCEMVVRHDVINGPIPADFDFSIPEIPHRVFISLGPDQPPVSSEPRTFSNEDLLAVRREEKNILLWGEITYNDAFAALLDTPRHVVPFKYKVVVYRDPLSREAVPINFFVYQPPDDKRTQSERKQDRQGS